MLLKASEFLEYAILSFVSPHSTWVELVNALINQLIFKNKLYVLKSAIHWEYKWQKGSK